MWKFTLMMQLHSIFLHVRKVRRMAGFCNAKSTIVRIEWVLNWITFFVARFASHILITAKLIWDASKFKKGVELPLALFGMAGMNLLNVFLGFDLFNAFRREKNSQHTNRHREWHTQSRKSCNLFQVFAHKLLSTWYIELFFFRQKPVT